MGKTDPFTQFYPTGFTHYCANTEGSTDVFCCLWLLLLCLYIFVTTSVLVS